MFPIRANQPKVLGHGQRSYRRRREEGTGKIKEQAGKALGDTQMETEGKADQAEGRVQDAVGHVKDAVREIAGKK